MLFKILIIPAILLISFGCGDTNNKQSNTKNTSKQSSATDNSKISFYINDRPVYKNNLHSENLEHAINNEIIYETALIDKLDQDPDIIKKVDAYKKSLIIGTVKGKVIEEHRKNNPVTEEQINDYYQKNIANYTSLNLIQVSSSDKEAIDQLYSKVSNGESFEETLSGLKKSGSKITTRQLQNTRKYNKLFPKLENGSISEPSSKGALNYTYVITEIQAQPIKYSKNKIKRTLISRSKPEAVKKYAETVKAKNNIEVKMAN